MGEGGRGDKKGHLGKWTELLALKRGDESEKSQGEWCDLVCTLQFAFDGSDLEDGLKWDGTQNTKTSEKAFVVVRFREAVFTYGS